MNASYTHAVNTGIITQHFIEHVVELQLYVAVSHLFHQFVDQDFLRAEFFPPVHDRHIARNMGEIQRFFHRCVTAPDDCNILPLVKKTVASGTTGYTPA